MASTRITNETNLRNLAILRANLDQLDKTLNQMRALGFKPPLGGWFGDLITKIKNAIFPNGKVTDLIPVIERGVSKAQSWATTISEWVEGGKKVYDVINNITVKATETNTASVMETTPQVATVTQVSEVSRDIITALDQIDQSLDLVSETDLVPVTTPKNLLKIARNTIFELNRTRTIADTKIVNSDFVKQFQDVLSSFNSTMNSLNTVVRTVMDCVDGFKGGSGSSESLGWTYDSNTHELDLAIESTTLANVIGIPSDTVQRVLSFVLSRNGFLPIDYDQTADPTPISPQDVAQSLVTDTTGSSFDQSLQNIDDLQETRERFPYDALFGNVFHPSGGLPIQIAKVGSQTADSQGFDIVTGTFKPVAISTARDLVYAPVNLKLVNSSDAELTTNSLTSEYGTFSEMSDNPRSVDHYWRSIFSQPFVLKHAIAFDNYLQTDGAYKIMSTHMRLSKFPFTEGPDANQWTKDLFRTYPYWTLSGAWKTNCTNQDFKVAITYTLYKLWVSFLTNETAYAELQPNTTGIMPTRVNSLYDKLKGMH